MKQFSLILLLALGVFTGRAQTFSYLTFSLADGTETSALADRLKLTFAGGNLVATDAQGTQSIPLTQLQSMHFASTATGIAAASLPEVRVSLQGGSLCVSAPAGVAVRVFMPDGRLVAAFRKGADGAETFRSGLSRGVYLVQVGRQTLKILAQ